MTDLEQAALDAFARPIIDHAKRCAAGRLDSLRCDAEWSGRPIDLDPSLEHRVRFDGVDGPSVPPGAREWARHVWLEAFTAAWAVLVDEHRRAA